MMFCREEHRQKENTMKYAIRNDECMQICDTIEEAQQWEIFFVGTDYEISEVE